jgi:ABC-type multidrug transport system ATPase subunit
MWQNKVGGITFKGISGGQRRRLSVGIALLCEPSMVFLDEPTSGLDGKASLNLVALMRRVASRGRTLLTTIHQPRA